MYSWQNVFTVSHRHATRGKGKCTRVINGLKVGVKNEGCWGEKIQFLCVDIMSEDSQHSTMKMICIEAFVFCYPANDAVRSGGRWENRVRCWRLKDNDMKVVEREGLCLCSRFHANTTNAKNQTLYIYILYICIYTITINLFYRNFKLRNFKTSFSQTGSTSSSKRASELLTALQIVILPCEECNCLFDRTSYLRLHCRQNKWCRGRTFIYLYYVRERLLILQLITAQP